MRTPYTPYAHPLRALHALRAPLTRTPYMPYACALCTPLMRLTCTPYMPYAHPLHALCAPLMHLMCTVTHLTRTACRILIG